MTPTKGTFAAGQAYVAFSRVHTHEKLHIINYKSCISKHRAGDARTQDKYVALCLLHVNIGNLKTKYIA